MSDNTKLEIIEISDAEIVTLAQVKQLLRINYDYDDEILTALIKVAIESAEQYLRQSLRHKTLKLIIEKHISKSILLPHGPANKIVRVQNMRKGTWQNMTPHIYSLSASGSSLRFYYPIIANLTEIYYEVGPKDQSKLPFAIKQGIMRHVNYMYDGCGEFLDMPNEVISLYLPYRATKL